MANDYAYATQHLLKLKTKAWEGVSWSADERAQIDRWLGDEGNISALAACCVLASERPAGCEKALGIIQEALQRKRLPPYVELSVYEALIHVEAQSLAPLIEDLLPFIRESLSRRAVNLDNTIYLLGKLGRTGERRALELLQSLTHDDDLGIRDNASRVLQDLERR
jgi:hypothetical protein